MPTKRLPADDVKGVEQLKRHDLLQEIRRLRADNARLRERVDEAESRSRDLRAPKGLKRLFSALAATTIYILATFIETWSSRIIVFAVLCWLAKLAGLPFAPLQVPFERRMQMLAIVTSFPIINMVECIVVFFAALWWFRGNTPVMGILVAYVVYIVFIDDRPSTGGHRWCKRFFRGLFIHRWTAAYYPAKLVKTADLDPTRKYVFGYHPHGIISVGAALNFGTDATGFDKLYPGIDMHVMTLKASFLIPWFREWIMSHGIINCSRRACVHTLGRGPGSSILLVTGGAAESLDAHPDIMDLTLLNRKGFVHVAIQNGAWLVPVISFGENQVFDGVPNARGSLVRRVQNWLQKKVGVAPVLFVGRGIFNYGFGYLPHRRAITSVVGAPIQCPHVPDAKRGGPVVDRWHKRYVAALKKLYNDYKGKYAAENAPEIRFY